MRYGVIADVHGNLPALQAVLAAGRRNGVDAWLCAGDIVGYGPYPNECVELVAETSGLVVAGNHDLLAVGALPLERQRPLVRRSHRWTSGVLAEDAHAYLRQLPRTAAADDTLLMAHGSLTDPEEYVTSEKSAARQLALLARADRRVLVLGHTHRFVVQSELRGRHQVSPGRPLSVHEDLGRVVLNPASVGQSRQLEAVPRARFMVLDLDTSTVMAHEVPYDVRACRRELRAQGLSPRSVHRRPQPVRSARKRARRLWDRAVAS
jgi:predicted phosphodiesterase